MYDKKKSFEIFDAIAPSYDRINRILSGGIDLYWRKKLKQKVQTYSSFSVLDLATGTGDQLFNLSKLKGFEKGIGIDLSKGMLKIAKEKSNGLHSIEFIEGDATSIPFENDSFNIITMSFGIRNVQNPLTCLKECYRSLKPSGKCLILEFSLPNNKTLKQLYLFYLRKVLPKIGNLLSSHSFAYTYLNQTIETFPYGSAFNKLMEEAGFSQVQAYPLTFGIATIYEGIKL